jgi:hypothetical protein
MNGRAFSGGCPVRRPAVVGVGVKEAQAAIDRASGVGFVSLELEVSDAGTFCQSAGKEMAAWSHTIAADARSRDRVDVAKPDEIPFYGKLPASDHLPMRL